LKPALADECGSLSPRIFLTALTVELNDWNNGRDWEEHASGENGWSGVDDSSAVAQILYGEGIDGSTVGVFGAMAMIFSVEMSEKPPF
jgi:hypothetical protein